MNVRYYLLYGIAPLIFVGGSILFAEKANANIIGHNHSSNLYIEYQTKTKPLAEAKSPYQKYAKVYFITKKYNITSDMNDDDIATKPIKEANCPNGTLWHQGLCLKECDTTAYPYDTAPEDEMGTTASIECMSGSAVVKRYMFIDCNDGWTLNDGRCDPKECSLSEYPYLSAPTSAAGTLKAVCKSGFDYHFGYATCYEGWDKEGGQCNLHTCNASEYPYTSNPGESAGRLITCKSGTDYQYGYTSCYDGWNKTGNQCVANTCTGYESDGATIPHCDSTESCNRGSDKVYRCKTCEQGYGVDSNGLCEVITCPIGQINVHTYWCSDAWRCLMPGG